MSLLKKIQNKNAQSTNINSYTTNLQNPPGKDYLSSVRDNYKVENPSKDKKVQTDKNLELKNRLQKQMLKEVKDDDVVEALVAKLDEMAVKIMQEDDSFIGKVNKNKVIQELVNNLIG
ncbi:MAG: hypothetical protein KGZ33_07580, partial [Alkaliphilus sp.]|nr:hypothetical protein [Alkaliphilus sp.]